MKIFINLVILVVTLSSLTSCKDIDKTQKSLDKEVKTQILINGCLRGVRETMDRGYDLHKQDRSYLIKYCMGLTYETIFNK